MDTKAEIDFLTRRLRQEEALVGAATHVRVRIIHGQLANAYRARIAALHNAEHQALKAA